MIVYTSTSDAIDESALSQFREITRDQKRLKELPVGNRDIKRKSILLPLIAIVIFPLWAVFFLMVKASAGIGVFLFAVAIVGMRWLFQVKPAHQRLRQTWAPFAYEELSQDLRLPIVLLRSFEHEQSKIKTSLFSGQRIEEVLVSATKRFGPTIAIGAPEDELPQLGAARAYVPRTNQWTAVALEWMHASQMIVTMAGSTPGLLWELNRIIEHGHLNKTIVVCTNNSADDRQIWRGNPQWDGAYLFAQRMARAVGRRETLAQSDLDDVIAMIVGSKRELVFIRATDFGADAYQRAIEQSIVEIFCRPRERVTGPQPTPPVLMNWAGYPSMQINVTNKLP
jgi:hypothetical protein